MIKKNKSIYKKLRFFLKNILAKYQYFLVFVICGIILFSHPLQAQQGLYLQNPLQNINNFFPYISRNNGTNDNIIAGCIRIDGRCLFRIAERPKELQQRINIIEKKLANIIQVYVEKDNANLEVKITKKNNLKDIYINVGNQETRLMTVTNWDAEIDGTDIVTKAELIRINLLDKIPITKQERSLNFLIRQLIISAITITILVILQIVIFRQLKRLGKLENFLKEQKLQSNETILNYLIDRKKINFQEVQYRLLQLLSIIIWLGGILLIFGFFPYTRFLQIILINVIRIPFRIVFIGIITYIRSVITITWLAAGIILALYSIGVNIGPILAGLGIFSLALSLGSQNLIKDAINGFFIILEDQYAVGDVIDVNDVGGLVENMNLRITQLRDSEGRLITIPNSEIRIVANLSSQWSRADLNIPIGYNTDVDKALDVITKVADNMSKEKHWKDKIIDQPEILGVDNFGERGLIIKVWIKTKPLQQWLVSREFRRRLIIALTKLGIPIPPPSQEIWFNNRYITNLSSDKSQQ